MLSVALGAAARIALRSFVSAARLSFGAAARYSSTVLAGAVFAGAFFTAGFFVVFVAITTHLPSEPTSSVLTACLRGRDQGRARSGSRARRVGATSRALAHVCRVPVRSSPPAPCISWAAHRKAG